MPNNDNVYNQALPLLALKGEVTIQFVDGKNLSGEFVAQDQFNIFVTVQGESLMIPRTQIRYIKGRAGQAIERDDSLAVQVSSKRSADRTEEAIPTLAPADTADDEDDDVTLFLEDDEDATVLLDIEDEEDATVFVDDDDSTMIVKDESGSVSQSAITACLECTAGPHAEETFKLQGGVTTLGRSSDNIISLSSDKEISRRHALITYKEGDFLIEDRGSLNGVLINDVRIDGVRLLKDGDSVLIGVSTLIFHAQ